MIEPVRGVQVDPSQIPVDDAATYSLFTAGKTGGLFQFGVGRHARHPQALPDRLEHLANALYRRGDADDRRLHQAPARQTRVVYEHPALEPILKETYGVMVYQEQVMQASALAGFTLGEPTWPPAQGDGERRTST
ncbi:MAG: hypothetical protein U0599_04050 [Vicinamibacteria bacterium]